MISWEDGILEGKRSSLFQLRPDGQSCPEENLVALQQNQVPDPEDGLPREAGREEGEEPLHGEHVGQRRLVARST